MSLIGVIKLLENGCQKIWRGKWNSHAEYGWVSHLNDKELGYWIKRVKTVKAFIRNVQFGSFKEQNRRWYLRLLKGKLGLIRQFISLRGSNRVII